MKQKAFFIIFKGLSMEQTMQIFWEGESSTLTLLMVMLEFRATRWNVALYIGLYIFIIFP